MSISIQNAEKAARMVGLDRGGPIRQDDRDAKIAQAGRLARFMDQLDRPLPDDIDLPRFPARF